MTTTHEPSPDSTDDEERRLKMALLQADIDNKKADTALKTKQERWEIWRGLATILLAAAAIAASARLADWIFPAKPQTIIIQQQPPTH